MEIPFIILPIWLSLVYADVSELLKHPSPKIEHPYGIHTEVQFENPHKILSELHPVTLERISKIIYEERPVASVLEPVDEGFEIVQAEQVLSALDVRVESNRVNRVRDNRIPYYYVIPKVQLVYKSPFEN
ncbi:uncharacterized protein LOC134223470 [Armigeres subalbatus]|uniref:uncharacterized protein LOC134223470 n=1 Tax=Armigeres subalbatus TaxID=124917 RepID=UPI002ED421CC